MPFCCFLKLNMQHVTLRCTGIGLWELEVYGHRLVTKAALKHSKGPSRGHEDGRAATCDAASGPPCPLMLSAL